MIRQKEKINEVCDLFDEGVSRRSVGSCQEPFRQGFQKIIDQFLTLNGQCLDIAQFNLTQVLGMLRFDQVIDNLACPSGMSGIFGQVLVSFGGSVSIGTVLELLDKGSKVTVRFGEPKRCEFGLLRVMFSNRCDGHQIVRLHGQS